MYLLVCVRGGVLFATYVIEKNHTMNRKSNKICIHTQILKELMVILWRKTSIYVLVYF